MADITYFLDILTSDRRANELKASEGKLVGTLCNFVPEEVILAVGADPVRLCGGDHAAAKRGEDVLPRDVCPAAKATLGLLQDGEGLWGALDLLVVPTSCDAKAKLPDVAKDFVPIHTMLLPRSKTDPDARDMWLKQVWEFARYMKRFTGQKLTARLLRAAVDLLNARQQAARRLFDLRKAAFPPISGEETLTVVGTSFYDNPRRWTDRVNALCDELEGVPERDDGPLPRRMLLTGAPLIYPNLKLVRLIEDVGALVVADDLCSGRERLHHPVVPSDWSVREMIRAIAERYLLPTTCPCFPDSDDRINRLLSLAEEFRADAAVYHSLRLCPLFDIESRRVTRELRDAGIPVLNLHTDYSPEDTEQLRTRIEAFLEMLAA